MCCKFKDKLCAELSAVCYTAATLMLISTSVGAVTYVGLIWLCPSVSRGGTYIV